MHPLWKSFFLPQARFSRIGMTLLVLAVILWISVDTFHDHELPDLRRPAEFLALSAAVLYGIDKAAGHLHRRNRD